MKLLYISLVLGWMCFGLSVLNAEQKSEQKIILKDDTYQFELRSHPTTKKITLYTTGAKEPLPDELSITLYDEQKTGRTVLLSAMKNAGGPQGLPQFQGKLDPFVGSMTGVELKIGLGTQKIPRILRWGH